MPDAPRQGFLKGLFGGGPKVLDREELFGESNAGKASSSLAKTIPGARMMDLQVCGLTIFVSYWRLTVVTRNYLYDIKLSWRRSKETVGGFQTTELCSSDLFPLLSSQILLHYICHTIFYIYLPTLIHVIYNIIIFLEQQRRRHQRGCQGQAGHLRERRQAQRGRGQDGALGQRCQGQWAFLERNGREGSY